MTQDNLRQFLQRYAQLKEDQNLRPGKDTLTSEFQVSLCFINQRKCKENATINEINATLSCIMFDDYCEKS